MKNKFKLLIVTLALALMLIVPAFGVLAADVSEIKVSENKGKLTVEGKASQATAVSIIVFDAKTNDVVAINSGQVNDGNYKEYISIGKAGDYVVKVADYNGGGTTAKANITIKDAPEEPTEPGKIIDSPDTGDNSMTTIWVCIGLTATGVMAFALKKRIFA